MLNDDLNKLCQLCTADEGLLCRQEVEEIDRLTSLFNFVSVDCTNFTCACKLFIDFQ